MYQKCHHSHYQHDHLYTVITTGRIRQDWLEGDEDLLHSNLPGVHAHPKPDSVGAVDVRNPDSETGAEQRRRERREDDSVHGTDTAHQYTGYYRCGTVDPSWRTMLNRRETG